MKVLGVLPARIGSTRFPGKPLALLRGEPMILHAWRGASRCDALARVVVATDDEAIAACVREAGGEAVLTRGDHASGTDRVAEVIARPEFSEFGAVVNVQGDEPLIDPRAIALAVAPVLALETGIATLAHEELDPRAFQSEDVVKVACDANGDALRFTRAPIDPARSDLKFLRHVGLYVYRREILLELAALPPVPPEIAERLEQLRAMWHGFKIRVVITPYPSVGVDTAADLAALERDWDRRTAAEPPGKESPR